MKNSLLPLITLLVLSVSAFAADKETDAPSQTLPFIGKAVFNFHGGSGTGEHLEIQKNGRYILGGCGIAACIETSKGKYTNPLPAEDGEKYLIHENTIYILKKNGEVKTGCMVDGSPCEAELYLLEPPQLTSATKAFGCVKQADCPYFDALYNGDSNFKNAILKSLKKSRLPMFEWNMTSPLIPIVIDSKSFIYGDPYNKQTDRKLTVLYSLDKKTAVGIYYYDRNKEDGKGTYFGNPSIKEQQVLRDIEYRGGVNPIGAAAGNGQFPIIVN